jgi:hypothetical protein
MENLNDYLQEVIPYVKERASAEGSILQYLKQKYGEQLSLDHFISVILQLHEEFWDLTNDMEGYSDVDERNYIAGKTDFADEMIELVLWFYECYLMKTDCSEYVGICPKCRGDKLYLREDEGYLFGSYIECGSCGEHLDFDDMYEFDNSIIP